MNTHSNHFDLNLEASALFNVPDAAGIHIVCREGTVWITLDNDLRDYVLEAGDTFDNAEHNRAVIYAMQPSRIEVTAAKVHRQPAAPRQTAAPRGLVFEQVLA